MTRNSAVTVLSAAFLLCAACNRQQSGGDTTSPRAPDPAHVKASPGQAPALMTQLPLAAPRPGSGAAAPGATPGAIPGAGAGAGATPENPQAEAQPAAAAPSGTADLEDVIKGMEDLVASAMSLQKALLTSHPSGQAATEAARQEAEKNGKDPAQGSKESDGAKDAPAPPAEAPKDAPKDSTNPPKEPQEKPKGG